MDRLLRSRKTRGLHVDRLHRARDVEHEHDRRLVTRHERAHVRPRHGDTEQRDRREEHRHRRVAAPRPSAGDAREHLEVRVLHRVAHPPALGKEIGADRERHDEQQQEQERVVEAHAFTAQMSSTWTIAATAGRPRNLGVHLSGMHRLPHAHVRDQRRCRRREGVEADGVRRAHEPLSRQARAGEASRARAHGELRDEPHRRLARLEHLVGRWSALPAARRGDAADVRAEAPEPAAPGETAEEDRCAGRRDPRIDRAAEAAHEADVERAAAQFGVEAADDEALRATQLVLDTGGGRDDPWSRDRDADLQPMALVRRAGGRRDGAGKHGGDRDRCSSHGTTLRNQKADSAPAASSTAIAPPAKRSVISRLTVRWPTRVASRR